MMIKMRSTVVVVSSFLALLLSVVVVSAQTTTVGSSLYEAMNDCSSLETELIEQVRVLEPTPGPTNSPTTEAPTAEPTGTPTTDYPTYDSDDSDDETDEPTLEPTRAPIADAGQGECPEDVKLIETHGSTMLPDDFVKAVGYNRETVTVRLTNTLSTETNLDAVYAYYQANTFDKECFSWHNVRPDVRTAVSDLEIQCTVTKPYALLQICIQDDALTKPILSEEDDAIIPQCCYAPPEAPPGTVCHLYEINCVSECLETDTDEVEVPGGNYGRPSVYSTGRRLRGGITAA